MLYIYYIALTITSGKLFITRTTTQFAWDFFNSICIGIYFICSAQKGKSFYINLRKNPLELCMDIAEKKNLKYIESGKGCPDQPLYCK